MYRTANGTPVSASSRVSVLTTWASTNQEIRFLVTSTANVCHWSLLRLSALARDEPVVRAGADVVADHRLVPGVYAASAMLRAPQYSGRSPAGTSSMTTR